MPLAPGITAALVDIVGSAHVVVLSDASAMGFHSPVDAVVVPGTSLEVAAIVRGAMACDLAVLTGDENVLREGESGRIVLNLARLDRVLEIGSAALLARVQPQVVLGRMYREIASVGLDVARVPTNAPPTVSDHVLSVEVVSSGGRLFRVSRRLLDGPNDAVDLVLKLDGVHCVVTELVISLLPALAVRRSRSDS